MQFRGKEIRFSRNTIVVTTILVLLGAFAVRAAINNSAKPAEENQINKKQVKVQLIATQDEVVTELSVSGTIVPRQYTEIRSLVPGTLQFIAEAGTAVSVGSSLFRIQDDNIENNYLNALQSFKQNTLISQERINQSQLALNSTEARKNLAEKNLVSATAQAEQLKLNSQDSAVISYGSAYNTLSQFLNEVSVGSITNKEYKYRNISTSQVEVKELAELNYFEAVDAFNQLSAIVNSQSLNGNLILMINALAKTKVLADSTVLLLQNALGGIEDLSAQKTLMTAFQTQINAQTASVLSSQNALRSIEISAELSVQQAQNQLDLASIELANSQIAFANSKNSFELEKTIAQSQLDSAAYSFGNLTLASPFSGKVLSNLAQVGQQISIGQSILELGNLDIVEIKVDVDTEFGQQLKQNDKVKINGTFDGFISSVDPVGNLNSGKIGIKVQADNSQEILVAGEIAEVSFALMYKEANLIVVPIKSVIIEPTVSYVFVVENGQAVRRSVGLGRVFGSKVSITSGLNPDDQLILRNGVFISQGDQVVVVE